MQATNHTTSIERQTLDWQAIAEGQRRARVLRSQAFTQLCVAVPWKNFGFSEQGMNPGSPAQQASVLTTRPPSCLICALSH